MHFDMDRSLGFALNKTALLSKGRFNQRLKAFDISAEQWSLMFRVVEKRGLSQKELSESTYKDQANITRSIDRLEKKGLLTRVDNLTDRRSFQLYPTPQGIELVEKIIPLSQEHNRLLSDHLSPQEIETLLFLLGRVYSNLEENPS